MAATDLHQPQQAQNSDFSLQSTSGYSKIDAINSSHAVSSNIALVEASPNSFFNELSRGFGERKKTLMRGKNRKNKSNTPSNYKMDVISLEFDLNISRLDLFFNKFMQLIENKKVIIISRTIKINLQNLDNKRCQI